MNTQTHIQAASSMTDSMALGSVLVTVGGALVLILTLIAAIAWIARRSGMVSRFPKGNAALTMVSSHSLGPRERVVVVDMQDKRLLLGVTSSQISCLATFERPETDSTSTSVPSGVDFQSMLVNLLKKSKPGASV